jgi:hypothetical protein
MWGLHRSKLGVTCCWEHQLTIMPLPATRRWNSWSHALLRPGVKSGRTTHRNGRPVSSRPSASSSCWVCPLQPVNRVWIGLNPTIVPLIGPLIGRAHANLGWSPQTHDAIYWTKGSQERLTLVPCPKTLVPRGPIA